MSEKQKEILNVFEKVLPKMSAEDQSYLLGYGEGMATAMSKKGDEKVERSNDNSGDSNPD